MQKELVTTHNVAELHDLCVELLSPSYTGAYIGQAWGPSGRGKSFAAAAYYVNERRSAYIPPLNIRTPLMMLSKICRELTGNAPGRTAKCLDVLSAVSAEGRRLVIIDEADLLQMEVVEMLRNLSETLGLPLVLITEEKTPRKWADRQRLLGRIRSLEFQALARSEVVLAYQTWLGVTLPPAAAQIFHAHARGSFHRLWNTAGEAEVSMRASGSAVVTEQMARELCDG